MFTSDEGNGWTQLGEGLMPNPEKAAAAMMEGVHQIGSETMSSIFGGSSLPELHNALGAMFGPEQIELKSALPQLDFFDSGGATQALQTAPGIEASGFQGGVQGLSPAASPGTIETLHSAGLEAGFNTAEMSSPLANINGGTDAATKLTDAASPLANIGKAFSDIMTKMTDMIGSIAQGPMGLLGGLLNFLLTIFTEILSSIGKALEETAQAAAALAADLWKKKMEMT